MHAESACPRPRAGPEEVPHTHPEAGADGTTRCRPGRARCGWASAVRWVPARPRWSRRLPGARRRAALAVVTNDIYTTEDADFLRGRRSCRRAHPRGGDRCCPHTAIRDDISANLDAVEDLEATLGPLDLVLVESGGDNLTATFSRGLVDRQIFVIDVAGGDKVPRKGGPGVTTADLLVINKTDLAPLVGADLAVMDRDARPGAASCRRCSCRWSRTGRRRRSRSGSGPWSAARAPAA